MKIYTFFWFRKFPIGTDEAEVLAALPVLGMFVENQWGSQPNRNDLSLIDDTLRLNNLTVPQAVRELGLVNVSYYFEDHILLKLSLIRSARISLKCVPGQRWSFHAFNPNRKNIYPSHRPHRIWVCVAPSITIQTIAPTMHTRQPRLAPVAVCQSLARAIHKWPTANLGHFSHRDSLCCCIIRTIIQWKETKWFSLRSEPSRPLPSIQPYIMRRMISKVCQFSQDAAFWTANGLKVLFIDNQRVLSDVPGNSSTNNASVIRSIYLGKTAKHCVIVRPLTRHALLTYFVS